MLILWKHIKVNVTEKNDLVRKLAPQKEDQE